MKISEIVKYIAAKEGGKVEVSVGNIREIVGIVSDLIATDETVVTSLFKNGARRIKKKYEKRTAQPHR